MITELYVGARLGCMNVAELLGRVGLSGRFDKTSEQQYRGTASKSMAELAALAYQRSFFSEKGPALATARAGNVIGGGDFSNYRLLPLVHGLPITLNSTESGVPFSPRPPGWENGVATILCLPGLGVQIP